MFGGSRIADLGVGLHLEDQGFTSELAAATSEANAMVKDLDGKRAEVTLAADLTDLKRKEAQAQRLLDRWRKVKAEATLTADTKHAEEKVQRLETKLRRLTAERHAVEVQVEDAGGIAKLKALQHELNATKRDARSLNREMDDGQGGILKWIRSLTQMTVRIGPFTSKLNQLGRALLLLGPIISGVAGSLIGLVSVLGAGIVGAAGLGSAAFAGAGLAAIGLMGVVKPLMAQYKSLSTVSNAYSTAVLKYGAHSKQAVAAQKQFNSALAGVSPEARKAFKSLADVKIGWQKMTGPARAALTDTMANGLKTVNALMPDFAKNTNKTADVIKNQLGGAFKGLRSRDGKSIINDLFGGFNKALPSMLHGLLSLGAAGGKFAAAFSRGPLQQVSGTFDSWAKHLNEVASNKSKMDAFAHSMTSAFTNVVHLGTGLGSVFKGLFRGAFGSGQNTVKHLADSLTSLGKRMNSVGGQRKLVTFFDDAARTTKNLWSTLKPVLGLFMQFATIMRPFSDVALQVAQGFTAIAQAVAKLAPAKAILEGLFAFQTGRSLTRLFGKRSGLSDLLSFLPIGPGAGGRRTERAVTRALEKRGIQQVERGAGSTVLRDVAETAGGGAAAGLLSRAGIRTILSRAGVGLAERAASLGPLAPIAAVLAGTYGIARLTGHRSDRVNRIYSRGESGMASASAARASQRSDNSAVGRNIDSIREARTALKGLHKEQDSLTKGSLAYRNSQLKEWDLHHKLAEGIKDRTKAAQAGEDQATREVAGRQKMLRAVHDLNDAHIAELKSTIAREAAGGQQQEDLQRLGILTAAQARAEDKLTEARNRQAAASLNVQRAQKGMKPISGAAAQSLGALDRLHPVIAGRIALKYESPKNAAAVGDAARRALGAGVSKKVVLQIIADSKNADAALRRLETVRTRKLMLSVGISGSDGVLSKLDALDRKAIRRKIVNIIEHGGQPTLNMIESIIQKQIRDKPFAVRAQVSEALAQISLVQGGLSQLQSKSIAINITKRTAEITTIETKRGHASGRRPGLAETALVGEGARHEYVVDPKRGVAFKTHGPMLAPLTDSAYVIPTEGGFADRGRSILMQAARDLGVPGFKKGRYGSLTHSQKKHDQRVADAMPIPKVVRYGSVPEQGIQNERDKAQKAYQDRANKVQALDKQIHTAKPAARAKLEAKRRRLYSGGKGQDSLNDLYTAYEKANDRYKSIHNLNSELSRLDTVQSTLAQKMSNDARAGDEAGYKTDRSQRAKTLKRLKFLYTRALKHARPGSTIAADLANKLASVNSERLDNNAASYASDSPSVEDYIKSHGLFGQFQNLELALSTAQGTDSINDDQTAIGGLQGFYGALLARGDLTTGEKIEVTDTLNGLRDQLKGLQGDTSGDAQAQIDQLNQRLTIANNTSALNAALASVAGGPGDIGTGGYGSAVQAGSGGGANGQTPAFVQNNYMLHPSDPHVLREIGAAATAGLGLQGFPNAPRQAPGY